MKIAVLTSGGDSPGMNAAVRAVVRSAIYHELSVFGVYYGYSGLINDNIEQLNVYSVADIIQRGGTILRSARCEEMYKPEGVIKAAETLKKHEIDGLVIIGGDGSFKGAAELSKHGINVIGIPGTIDNDIAATDYTIGFDTALNTVVDAIGKIRDTTSSHNRMNIVETMGRSCGNLAIAAGIAGGAEAIIIPEIPYDLDKVVEKLLKGKDRGKLHSIIVFAEGAGNVSEFGYKIEALSKVTARTTVLGYIQRGGSPSSFDRILASRMGAMAVSELMAGATNKAICIKNNAYVSVDINEVVSMKPTFYKEMYDIAMQLSI